MNDNYKIRDAAFTQWFFNEQDYIGREDVDANNVSFNAGWRARKEFDLAIIEKVLTKIDI